MKEQEKENLARHGKGFNVQKCIERLSNLPPAQWGSRGRNSQRGIKPIRAERTVPRSGIAAQTVETAEVGQVLSG